MDVRVEFGVNETDLGTTMVQDSTNVGVGFGVNETDEGGHCGAREYKCGDTCG